MDAKNKIFSASFQQSLEYANNPKHSADSTAKDFIKNYFHEKTMVRILFTSIIAILFFGVIPYGFGVFFHKD